MVLDASLLLDPGRPSISLLQGYGHSLAPPRELRVGESKNGPAMSQKIVMGDNPRVSLERLTG